MLGRIGFSLQCFRSSELSDIRVKFKLSLDECRFSVLDDMLPAIVFLQHLCTLGVRVYQINVDFWNSNML